MYELIITELDNSINTDKIRSIVDSINSVEIMDETRFSRLNILHSKLIDNWGIDNIVVNDNIITIFNNKIEARENRT